MAINAQRTSVRACERELRLVMIELPASPTNCSVARLTIC